MTSGSCHLGYDGIRTHSAKANLPMRSILKLFRFLPIARVSVFCPISLVGV